MIYFNIMTPFSLLIKPASADCNLRCDYCFYIDHLSKLKKIPRMSYEVLEKMIQSYMNSDQNQNFIFGWQGGEPTLMGLKFFQKAIDLQILYAPKDCVISNGLQTNGTMISDEIAKFFAEYKFLLGVSLDGPPYLHNGYRKTNKQKGTHNMVLEGINQLKKYNVEFNILTLVNNINVKEPIEVYNYLKGRALFYHQYIPCVEFDENNELLPYCITAEEWGNFLCQIFDEWVKEDINKISIRLFDSIIEYLVCQRYNVCNMGTNCCQYFVVEYDGSIYPCDFFVQENLKLGNVMNDCWKDLINSPIYKSFGNKKSQFNKECITCCYLEFCNGDCQKYRVSKSNPRSLSVLCKGWKRFYTHTLSRFQTIAQEYIKGNRVFTPAMLIKRKVGRNETCPCGSGKKYKNCCMI
jgi:uncharacterized protein